MGYSDRASGKAFSQEIVQHWKRYSGKWENLHPWRLLRPAEPTPWLTCSSVEHSPALSRQTETSRFLFHIMFLWFSATSARHEVVGLVFHLNIAWHKAKYLTEVLCSYPYQPNLVSKQRQMGRFCCGDFRLPLHSAPCYWSWSSPACFPPTGGRISKPRKYFGRVPLNFFPFFRCRQSGKLH